MSETLKTIVIGTTLLDESMGIVRTGATLARAADASPWLLHAYTLPAFPSEIGSLDAQWVEDYTEDLRKTLRQQSKRSGIADLPGFAPDQACLLMGSPHRQIVEMARKVHADLIVIGASEGGAVHRAFLGSTADRVVRKAPCPVLVVRSETAFPPARVMAPVDLSPVSANALRWGLSLLKGIGASPEIEALFVLNALEVDGSLQFTPDQIERFANDELHRFLEENAGAAPHATSRVLTGFPREEILRNLDERKVDLVILGTHGRSGFERLMIGSVAAQVLERATCNVLLVPPTTERPEMRHDADWRYVSDEMPVEAGLS